MPFVCSVNCHEGIDWQSYVWLIQCRAGNFKTFLLLKLRIIILIIWRKASSVCAIHHMADKRESNVCDWMISRVYGWTFWKVFEGTGMPERLPDLGLSIKGLELQPEEERTSEIRERPSESIRERESRRDGLSTSLCLQPMTVLSPSCHLASVVCSSTNIATESMWERVNILEDFLHCLRVLLHCSELFRNLRQAGR